MCWLIEIRNQHPSTARFCHLEPSRNPAPYLDPAPCLGRSLDIRTAGAPAAAPCCRPAPLLSIGRVCDEGVVRKKAAVRCEGPSDCERPVACVDWSVIQSRPIPHERARI